MILEELDLEGSQLQSAVQSAFDVIILRFHKKGATKQVLISLSSGACRLHETFRAVPKPEKPLRFAQFLSSKAVNGWVTNISQLGDNRIVKIVIRRSVINDDESDSITCDFILYIRLWSNAANFIVTDEDGNVLDAMRRHPKRGEITGGKYQPEIPAGQESKNDKPKREYEVRAFDTEGSFNKKIDEYYAQQSGQLSLESLREQARRNCEGSLGRINAALEKLREKEKSFAASERLKIYGDLILSNIADIKDGSQFLDTEIDGEQIKIELTPRVSPAAMAQKYYEQYKKARSGLADVQREIAEGEKALTEVTEKLNKLLSETNPLILAKLLKTAGAARTAVKSKKDSKHKTRPGLAFKRGDWLIIVGRDAKENDELLRRHVKGNDLWLHARDFHGSYVFIKQRAGKSYPLDIMLDAGNLALFYSKGRNNGEGDLFYTQVKYLRRAKDGPKGLVIPTQEKNLRVKLEDSRLRSLENCKV